MPPAISDGALAEFADVVMRIAREIDPNGPQAPDIVPLTGTEALVMRWVHHNPGASPSAVARATALQRSNCSVALRSLVAKGMIERQTAPDDARAVRLLPTALADESVRKLHAFWVDRLRSALDGDDAGVEAAAALLARVEGGLRRGDDATPTPH
ncbi:DNA-binding transcriptional regulator, MarR family [Microbacterium sp. ru370.1]|uniref:MarR family winged helix-turn-helix transcriptional regulator n=1 Tax=unclassified Microbacterium TaxID=2609290 RepID=UPI0008867F0C|nr:MULTISPECIES: MarR family winged helix-turn-helix transcriptional regulator [unclassified Microbacterium]SDO49298.1 DNA-binding transcriptional regulator, MarR family [Microbacterium sp. ru370.1]SIT82694.1 DNA-binding transcriptional regulator, MarR family [Microbacterium sp. RU1D]